MRAQDGVRMASIASELDSLIKKFRSSNNDLRGLREQITELQKPTTHHPRHAKIVKQEDWDGLVEIRGASKALHDALVGSWNCGHQGHLGHTVKLFVETHRVSGEIRMNLAIVCRSQTNDAVKSTLVQLEVRSQNLAWHLDPRRREPYDLDAFGGRRNAGFWDRELPRQSQRLGSFQGQSSAEYGPSNGVRWEGSSNSGLSNDICRQLTQQLEANCLGHLDFQTDEVFRHSFYPAKKNSYGDSRPSDRRPVTIDEVLDESLGDFLSTIDRLKLARSMVSAVLKFHSTPWLRDFWRLRDLAFFRGGQDEEVSEALRSLHVGIEVAQRQFDSMDGVQDSSDMQNLSWPTEDELIRYGINNLTLHSLGVALLQIDRWTRVSPGDVVAVRKMASRSSSLGPRYRELTQKCLRCDFGFGSDLTQWRLQRAVYENVVETLEAMISSLDLTED
ncbi:hypothetical protein CDEST_08687 [Colletotrichum destructivum]|uniref:DUF7580 domain-containing protein n=1 Tax=Colletotrichum destructivum TaxID=34406 RepID=A0AAX4IJJ2_9PEZI|nr:hypothetical protein CDEST_08687 [Colletotrichum destructivum]